MLLRCQKVATRLNSEWEALVFLVSACAADALSSAPAGAVTRRGWVSLGAYKGGRGVKRRGPKPLDLPGGESRWLRVKGADLARWVWRVCVSVSLRLCVCRAPRSGGSIYDHGHNRFPFNRILNLKTADYDLCKLSTQVSQKIYFLCLDFEVFPPILATCFSFCFLSFLPPISCSFPFCACEILTTANFSF